MTAAAPRGLSHASRIPSHPGFLIRGAERGKTTTTNTCLPTHFLLFHSRPLLPVLLTHLRPSASITRRRRSNDKRSLFRSYPDQSWDPGTSPPRETMVSTAGGIVIAIVVLLFVAAIGWVVFTQLRARRLGLPPPSLSSYLPWHKEDSPYGPPHPAPGGIVGWFNDQIRKFKNRNNRSAAGAYEGDLGGDSRGRRGFGPLDPDEAWDSRVGNEVDSYGYYEEDIEGGRGRGTEHGGGSYRMNVPTVTRDGAHGFDEEEDRGRRASRSPGSGPGGRNPFDDDNAHSLRGVSPRPIDTNVPKHQSHERGQGHGDPDSAGSSPTERRSVFRENV